MVMAAALLALVPQRFCLGTSDIFARASCGVWRDGSRDRPRSGCEPRACAARWRVCLTRPHSDPYPRRAHQRRHAAHLSQRCGDSVDSHASADHPIAIDDSTKPGRAPKVPSVHRSAAGIRQADSTSAACGSKRRCIRTADLRVEIASSAMCRNAEKKLPEKTRALTSPQYLNIKTALRAAPCARCPMAVAKASTTPRSYSGLLPPGSAAGLTGDIPLPSGRNQLLIRVATPECEPRSGHSRSALPAPPQSAAR